MSYVIQVPAKLLLKKYKLKNFCKKDGMMKKLLPVANLRAKGMFILSVSKQKMK